MDRSSWILGKCCFGAFLLVQSLLDNKFQLSPQVCQGVYFDNSWEEIVVQYIEKLAHVDMTQVSPSLCTASGLGLSSTMTRGKDAVIDIMVRICAGFSQYVLEPLDVVLGKVCVFGH